MKFLRDIFDQIAPNFEKGGRFEKLHPLWEMQDTGMFTPGDVTQTSSHVRDGLDLKRMMIIVVIALVPCAAMAMYNTGYQALLATAHGGLALDDWRMAVWGATGIAADFSNPLACIILGALFYLPVYITVMLTGAVVEIASAVIRGHEVNEGFLVTGMLLPLTLPATIPLWMVALGMAFGVIFGKEVFGGTGMNFLNPALVARAFLFFAYPASMSGEAPWIAADLAGVDSYTGATLLAQAAESGSVLAGADWWDAFYGFIPGSMGETSALACLLGCALLLWTKVASGRTMAGVVVGTIAMSLLLNIAGSDSNPLFAVPWYWHMVLGGWALGTVFMATDPVSSAFTDTGKFYYGLLIGILCILIRVINPAYPEGMMLAILFMNMFAPLIDHFSVQGNIKRRLARSAA
ncbi:MAG: NADH:ubiquinone reductase (Na(+)-transporting) subunit B [Deltaproteobacteria bacterium]|nr:NADH:ubiquinone reductase (Na(+)-transporting) subunit B [Deltaproteobacteria bacterium]MBW2387443.1 NADH:ubiquinone reductase (Na(+)-transporting) subunit B [Deltaproteobacteria bacterium]MBW2726511.1 NADH:ubiquinone reductase (Na(+)-transporting) subunit B [Deltaproteobacteria bacterium]